MLANSQPLSILVVEDNQSDFVLFCEYLKLSRLPTKNILHAERLGEALQLLHKHQPDLIFLDLSLPDSDGINSFVRINEEARHISIIVLSGLDDKQVALHITSTCPSATLRASALSAGFQYVAHRCAADVKHHIFTIPPAAVYVI